MSKERQKRKQEEIKLKILDAARKIISQEGVKGLSIRKITNAIDYSPAIIYHYFKDKNEIVETLTSEEYRRILTSLQSIERNENEPEKEMKESFRKYIKAALVAPEEYRAFILSDDPLIISKTSLLHQGVSKNSPTMGMLCENIQRGVRLGRYKPCDPELTAQILWTSVFGLVMKLIMEKDVPQVQIDRLIDHHFELVLNGLMSIDEE
ncbi:TetR/AcrR family transcriptional regulator [Vallitalea okinawensis]|uniref:TetR/AcrR family transcriptional regulator n=1 Tax=Vallitalea okinawensis TaxID=2078660 RepID=UPI001300B9F3|nr:TetR/AcrR family transcriptional regulator [Vallitalea okinawensis]